jgi:hypothetical protein
VVDTSDGRFTDWTESDVVTKTTGRDGESRRSDDSLTYEGTGFDAPPTHRAEGRRDMEVGDESTLYENQIAGNTEVNETQVRRAGRLVDDRRAADALQGGDLLGAASVQQGRTAEERADDAARDRKSSRKGDDK